MTTATKKKRKRRVPTEERKAADAKIRTEAAAVLAAPEGVARMIEKLMHAKLGPRVLSYSLRNQALVISQAEDRAIPLSDVRGRGEWRALGRWPRKGQPGLRITARNGNREDDAGTPALDEPQPADPAAEDNGEGEESIGFHMVSVWDRSMTDGDELEEPPPEVPDPARVLLDGLTEQVERHEYRVVTAEHDVPASPSNVDHDAKTITVMPEWSARDKILTIALALAQILTDASDRAAARKAARQKAAVTT
jgi:hypothetical protein